MKFKTAFAFNFKNKINYLSLFLICGILLKIYASFSSSNLFAPTYYYIGHFSKFIKPGALRVSTTTSRSAIESTSFKNKDGKIVTVVMNKTDRKIGYKLIVGNSQAFLEIAPRAMQSIIY